MSLNSALGSWERIRVAAVNLLACYVLKRRASYLRPNTTPRFLGVIRLVSLCCATLWNGQNHVMCMCGKLNIPVEMQHQRPSSIVMFPRQVSDKFREHRTFHCRVANHGSGDEVVMQGISEQGIWQRPEICLQNGSYAGNIVETILVVKVESRIFSTFK